MVAHLPPDISYCLDCSAECFDITADVLCFYHRFNEVPLAPLVDARDENRRDRDGVLREDVGESLRGLARLYFTVYNDWFYTSALPVEQAWCVASGVRDYGRKAGELADHLLDRFISHSLSAGDDPALRRNQQNWLDRSRIMTHGEKITAQLARKARIVPPDMLHEAMTAPQRFINRLPATPEIARLAGITCATTGEAIDVILPGENDVRSLLRRIQNPSKRKLAKRERQGRQVLKKSSAFLSRLIGSQDVSMFVSGKQIRIEGNRFTFAITKGNILAENHGALSITVHDRRDDNPLFDLCWYVSKTPALDQISALALAVKVGDEDEIIRIGNIFGVTDHMRDRTDLCEELDIPSYQMTRTPGAMMDFAFPDDDRLMHNFPGTQAYRLSNPGVYLDFARRVRKRLFTGLPFLLPDAPQTIRQIREDRVGVELLRPPEEVLLQAY